MSTLLVRDLEQRRRREMSGSTDTGDEVREARPSRESVRPRRRWVPLVAALLCFLIGLSNVLGVLNPGMHARLHRLNAFVPGTLTSVGHAAAVIVGLMLLLLSHGLRRRKRRAWQAVVALLAFDIAIHFLHSPRFFYTITVAIVLLIILLYYHDEFYAVGDPRTRWSALWVFGALVAADLGISLGFLSTGGLIGGNWSVPARIQDVVYELVGVSGPITFVSDGRGDFYHLLTTALGLFTVVVTAYLFLRAAGPMPRLSPTDAARIRELLGKHGDRDSLGYFALRSDKSVIWSPTGKACVCYRVVAGVMLAAGDPIGDPEAWPGAIAEFLGEAERHAWRPAVMGCSELGAEVWCREGDLTALELGDEALVNVGDFSLSGRPMRNVRQMVTRVSRAGYVASVRRVRDIPREELAELVRVAGSWRGVLLFMSKWFQIESLYKFNAKFSPTWEPRFFVFPSGKDAPRIALAAMEAEAFLVLPTLDVRRAVRKIGLARHGRVHAVPNA
jgi:lysyl-tRNA synthetase class 2